jgi:hypothetical protein
VKIFLGVLGALILVLAGGAFYMGAYQSVSITEETKGPYRIVYKPTASPEPGDVARITAELAQMLDGLGVDQRSPFEVYLPDGSAEIGFVIEDVMTISLSDGTRIRVIPEQEMMVTRFPWRNPASFFLGSLKVDPALQAYRHEKGYIKTEAMTTFESADAITYLQPVRKK